jgi:hypothetical protein
VITRASIDEISLTDRPANRFALVRHRHFAASGPSFHELMQRKVQCLRGIVGALQTFAGAQAQTAAPSPRPRRQSDFSLLVAAMNANAEMEA